MPNSVIDIRQADDLRDVVHRAVQALAEGQIVAFPTETVYGLAVSARCEEALARLLQVKGRAGRSPLTLAVKSADDALDYAPDMSPLARRLARRCWPGPVTLVVDGCNPDSLLGRLPASVRRAVLPTGTIGLRVPAHPMILDVMRMLAGPIILTSANRSGQADAVTGAQVATALGAGVSLILDDGPCRYGQPSSVVQATGTRFKLLRHGVVPPETMRRLASFMVLIVCTGNTCRSPMAEVLTRKLVADRLGCNTAELDARGVVVISAGLAAVAGGRPSLEAVTVMNEMGLALSDHESQPLTEQLVRHADTILTMTAAHRQAIVSHWPDAAPRTQLLRRDAGDVSDPVGGSVDVYRQCALQIKAELQVRVNELAIP
ncbi:MAG: threonylcarbamoyl-AMP synthase [Planctomycetes bacterium RBG_16_64_10]|nr:MAG: threonylcarbamoyl-AMP synthase [Planctomycetes bacterium RBG_16_64_10]